MKKVFILSLLSCFLCACSSMHGLRVHNTGKKGMKIVDGGRYYNDTERTGHNSNVKHKVIDETHAEIQIPVRYKEQVDKLPEKLPQVLEQALENYDLGSIGECNGGCSVNSKKLTLSLQYEAKYSEEDCEEQFTLGLLLFPLLPVAIYNCAGNQVELLSWKRDEYWISNPFETLNKQNLGVQIDLATSPKKMSLKCDEKACEVQDEKGKIVNQIYVFKIMSVDQNRINQLLKEEEAERIRKEKAQRIFEAKQKKSAQGYIR